jgi:enamine deaminase RidA (YjgF/YER057c/UK114 family)
LPDIPKVPADVAIPFAWARVYGDRIFLSGHGPQGPDGALVGPFGRVGMEVTAEQAAEAARLAVLAMLGSLKRALGDLDRVAAWLRVDGYVLVAPGFHRTTGVINAASDLLIRIFGSDIATHARTAMGVAATPLNCPVVLAAEVAIRD